MTMGGKRTVLSTNGVNGDKLKTLLPPASRKAPVAITEDHVVSLIMARRGREAVFGKDLFSDPAWDILLELYAARLASRTMAVSELATAIGTPFLTTTRWVSALEARGFVERGKSAGVQHAQIRLTPEGASRMKRLVHHWGSAFVTT